MPELSVQVVVLTELGAILPKDMDVVLFDGGVVNVCPVLFSDRVG